jgi:hypothetical protein
MNTNSALGLFLYVVENMPEIEKGLSSGTKQPLAADWATLFITSLERQQIEELFQAHGW